MSVIHAAVLNPGINHLPALCFCKFTGGPVIPWGTRLVEVMFGGDGVSSRFLRIYGKLSSAHGIEAG